MTNQNEVLQGDSPEKIYFRHLPTEGFLQRQRYRVFPSNPTQEQISTVRQSALQIIERAQEEEEAFHRMTHNNPKLLQNMIDEHYKQELARGNHLSRPAQCSWFLTEKILARMQATALASLQRSNTSHFISTYDMSTGVYSVVTGILLAESSIKGNEEEFIRRNYAIEESMTGRIIPVETKEKELPVIKAEANELALLLRKNPSGFGVVDNIVKKIKTETESPSDSLRLYRIHSNQVPEFVYYGAQYASRAYKELIYPNTRR